MILACLFTLLVFDAHPLSPNLLAKAHGRADFVFLMCKIALVIIIDIWPIVLGRWAVSISAVLVGILWAGAHIFMLPMYHHSMYVVSDAILSLRRCIMTFSGLYFSEQKSTSHWCHLRIHMGCLESSNC